MLQVSALVLYKMYIIDCMQRYNPSHEQLLAYPAGVYMFCMHRSTVAPVTIYASGMVSVIHEVAIESEQVPVERISALQQAPGGCARGPSAAAELLGGWPGPH